MQVIGKGFIQTIKNYKSIQKKRTIQMTNRQIVSSNLPKRTVKWHMKIWSPSLVSRKLLIKTIKRYRQIGKKSSLQD